MASQQEWLEAGSPATSPQRLSQLAAQYPSLHPLIIANPSCPALLRDQLSAMRPQGLAFGMPAPPPSSPPPTPSSPAKNGGRNRAAMITGVIAAVLAVTLVAVLIVLWPRENDSDDVVLQPKDAAVATNGTPQETTTPAPTQNPGPTDTPVPTAIPTEVPTELPKKPEPTLPEETPPQVPLADPNGGGTGGSQDPSAYNTHLAELAGAGRIIHQNKIDTPSKNISCELRGSGVFCSIKEREFGAGGCTTNHELYSVSVTEFGTQEMCGERYLGQPGDYFYELQYGETTVNGDFGCQVNESRIKCMNLQTGRGFTLSRSGYGPF